MWSKRTDLAVEAREMWNESAEETSELPGVEAEDSEINGFKVTTVRILDENGQRELGKPVGTYVTIELDAFIRREDDAFTKGAEAVAQVLNDVLKLGDGDAVTVVGMGNAAITPDAIGPFTARNTVVTRHLVEQIPEHFGNLRQVSVFESGVMGTTGIESAELIKAVVDRLRPKCVIAVDALASRKLSRVCRTVQIADTGIVPGSGVGNSRSAVNAETLGVPVIALGVPTVVDAGTLAADLAEQAGANALKPEDFEDFGGSMIVTPKEIDARVNDISRLLGFGINFALHKGITADDINLFLG